MRDSHLRTQSNYLQDLNKSSNERISYLEDERKAMQDVVDTLTNQNQEILAELD